MSAEITDKRYLSLRKKLDALQYTHQFGVESTVLVERLLNDLLRTTEGFQTFKKQCETLKNSNSKNNSIVEPLRKENFRLSKENDELHLEIIKVKEELEFKDTRWQTVIHQTKGERDEAVFMKEKAESETKKMSQENMQLKFRVNELMEKLYSIDLKGGLSGLPPEMRNENLGNGFNKFGGPSDKMTMARPLDESEGGLGNRIYGEGLVMPGERNSSDQIEKLKEGIRTSEEMLMGTQRKLKESERMTEQLRAEVSRLGGQVQARENEISRLQEKLRLDGLNEEKLIKHHETKAQEEKLERQTQQMDYLLGENRRLNEELTVTKKDFKSTVTLRKETGSLRNEIEEYKKRIEQYKRACEENEVRAEHLKKQRKEEEQHLAEQRRIDQQEIQKLLEEIKSLKKQLSSEQEAHSKLREKATTAEQTVSAYQSDKRSMGTVLSEIQKEKEGFMNMIEKSDKEKDRLLGEIDSLKFQINSLKSQVTSKERDVTLSSASQNRVQKENEGLREEVSNLKEDVSRLETEILNLNTVNNDLKNDLLRCQRQSAHALKEVEAIRSEETKTRVSVDTQRQTAARLQILNESLQRDLEFVKRDNQTLEEQMHAAKSAQLVAEAKAAEYFGQLKTAGERRTMADQEIELIRDQLSGKIREARQAENDKLELSRTAETLKGELARLGKAQERLRNTQQQLSEANNEKMQIRNQHDQLALKLEEEMLRFQKMEELYKKEANEKQQLLERLKLLGEESRDIETKIKRAGEREREIRSLEIKIESLVERENGLRADLDVSRRETSAIRKALVETKSRLELAESEKKGLGDELEKMNKESQLIRSSENGSKSLNVKLQEKVNMLELEISDLKDELASEKLRSQSSQSDLLQAHALAGERAREISGLNEAISHLKGLIEALERSKGELMDRLQSKNDSAVNESILNRDLRDKAEAAKRDYEALSEEMIRIQETLVSLDKERDEIQILLDEKTESEAALIRENRELNNQLKAQRERNGDDRARADELLYRLQMCDGDIKTLALREQDQKLENERLVKILSLKENENAALANDLNVLTRENGRLSQELVDVMRDRDMLRDQMGYSSNSEKLVRQNLKAIELEREDILTNYRVCAEENDRLQKTIEEITVRNQELFEAMRLAEGKAAAVRGEQEQGGRRIAQLQMEIHTYERQLAALSSRLESAESHIKHVETEKAISIQQMNSIKSAIDGVEANKDDAHRKVMLLQNERIELIEDLHQVKNDMDILRTQCEIERGKVQDLEDLINMERKVAHDANQNALRFEKELAEVRNERDRLKVLSSSANNNGSSLNSKSFEREFGHQHELNKMIDNLQKTIEERNEEIRILRGEQRALRDENNRMKVAMFRLESDKKDAEKRPHGASSHRLLSGSGLASMSGINPGDSKDYTLSPGELNGSNNSEIFGELSGQSPASLIVGHHTSDPKATLRSQAQVTSKYWSGGNLGNIGTGGFEDGSSRNKESQASYGMKLHGSDAREPGYSGNLKTVSSQALRQKVSSLQREFEANSDSNRDSRRRK